MERYGDLVYRPGDDVPDLRELTTEEAAERDAEIAALFAQNSTNGDN